MVNVIIHGLEDARHQLFSEQFTLTVDIHVAASAEIDTLKRTGLHYSGLIDLHGAYLTGLADEQ